MKNYLTKPVFYVFIDVEKSLCDYKHYKEIKKKDKTIQPEDIISTEKVEIFNNFLKELNKSYLIDLVITSKDPVYNQHLLYQNDFDSENIRVIDYLFCKNETKSQNIEYYLTMLKKDKNVTKVHNFIIFDNKDIKLSKHLKNHLVKIDSKNSPLSKQSITNTINTIYDEINQISQPELNL